MAILGRAQPNLPVIDRNTLVDDPVLTTPEPVIVSAPVPASWFAPTEPVISRSSTTDVVVVSAVVPAPVIVSQPTRPSPAPVAILGRTLPPDLTTPAPFIVAQPTRPTPAATLILDRGTLVDDPVLTTASPVIVGQPVIRPSIVPPTIGRSSTQDAVITTGPTVVPVIASESFQPLPFPPITARSTLVDPPVLTTPAPVVSAPIAKPTQASPPVISRSSLADVVVTTGAAPQPVVVWQPTRPQAGIATIGRGSLQDPPVLVTPGPVVVAAPRWQLPTFPLIVANPLPPPPPPPFTVGVLTATDAATSTLTLAAAAGTLTATDASGRLTASDQATGTLTASEQAGGPS